MMRRFPPRAGAAYSPNNRRSEYNGRMYASAMEARFAERLDLEQRAGIVKTWTPQVRLELEVVDVAGGPPIRIGVYVIDFVVIYANGETHAIETKGWWTEYSKLKRRVFEATWLRAHPEVKYRVVTKVGKYGATTDEEPRRARKTA